MAPSMNMPGVPAVPTPIYARPGVPLKPQPVSAKPERPLVIAAKAFQCKECSQSFDTEHALGLHVKYIHRSKEE